ncbi:MAG: efflux system, outer rane lipoprotein NodT family, partial [Chthoniobacteraceae bacterium]|nr:efflux system, outer rane lipoprotein NodT family [Chthoniobacteraceae bacterium]
RIIGSGIFPAGNGVSGPDSFAGQALTNTSNDFSTQLSLGYEVDLFGRIRHAYAQGRATAQAFEADRRAVELSLTSQVAASYFTLRALDSQMAVLRRTLRLRADAIQILEARLKAGVAGDIDVFRARFELANAEAELADITQRRTESENALAVLCGQPASGFHLAEHPLDHGLPPPVPITIPAQLLTQRPDLVEEERRVAAEGEGIKSVKAEFFPTVNVGANYGFESADSAELFKDQSHTWSITGGISIPIFEGGRNAARLNAARAREQQAIAAYQQAALTAFKEAENALSGLRQHALQAEARGRAAENARHVFDIAQKSYREGAINYFEVIDAQRILLNAELAEVQTLNTRYSATIDLIRAVGGGYEP